MFDSKVPTTDNNYVGIEIEFSCPLTLMEAKAVLIEHNLERYMSIGYDGQGEVGHESFEWRFLLKETELNTVLPKLGTLLSSLGGMVNTSHGMHVHLDMRNRDAKVAYERLVLAQNLLFAVANKKRLSGSYCKPIHPTCAHGPIELAPKGKYTAINPLLREYKNTIEVRIHEGCIDGYEMLLWCKLLIAIVNSDYNINISSIDDIKQLTNFSKVLKQFAMLKIKSNRSSSILEGGFYESALRSTA